VVHVEERERRAGSQGREGRWRWVCRSGNVEADGKARGRKGRWSAPSGVVKLAGIEGDCGQELEQVDSHELLDLVETDEMEENEESGSSSSSMVSSVSGGGAFSWSVGSGGGDGVADAVLAGQYEHCAAYTSWLDRSARIPCSARFDELDRKEPARTIRPLLLDCEAHIGFPPPDLRRQSLVLALHQLRDAESHGPRS
jgi:hypothetical protein